jgi:Flp pilus assembly protein TadG
MLTSKREEGQALVETSLSIALLFLMMLGVVELGQFAYAAIEVMNTAKAAAQYGSQTPGTAANLAGMLRAAQNEYSTPSAVSLLSPTATTGYACNCSGSTTAVSCTNNSLTAPTCGAGTTLEVTITVQTQVNYSPGIQIPGLLTGPIHIKATAIQKVLQ